jgi:hypothetical protein
LACLTELLWGLNERMCKEDFVNCKVQYQCTLLLSPLEQCSANLGPLAQFCQVRPNLDTEKLLCLNVNDPQMCSVKTSVLWQVERHSWGKRFLIKWIWQMHCTPYPIRETKLKVQSSLGIYEGLVPSPPANTKFWDAEVLYGKLCTVSYNSAYPPV